MRFTLLLAAAQAMRALTPFEAVEPHMGTLVRIKLYADNPRQARQAFRAAFDRIGQLDQALSDYKPDSELNRLGRAGVARPVQVSQDLYRVLAASQTLAEESHGAFDVTIGSLTHLWRKGRVPDAADLSQARARTGFRKLHLDAASSTARLDQPGMQLDLGGIAKGYAADQALAVITKLGIGRAMVAASGDLAFSDAPPGQSGWRVGLDLADRPEAAFARVLYLSNAAVSTSGDTEQHVDAGGKRYSHIIDPSTGLGLTSAIRVSVIAPRGITADGLSTAVSILGPGPGMALIEKYPGAAAILIAGGNRVLESARFHGFTLH